MKVPLIDLEAQYRPIRDDILAAVRRDADDQRFSVGPRLDAPGHELSRTRGIGRTTAVSSGIDVAIPIYGGLTAVQQQAVVSIAPFPQPTVGVAG